MTSQAARPREIDLDLRIRCAAATPRRGSTPERSGFVVSSRRGRDRFQIALPRRRESDLDPCITAMGGDPHRATRHGRGRGEPTPTRGSRPQIQSIPQPPPACATRRVEIDARASSFGLPETSLSAAVLLSLSGDTLPSRKARDTIREKKIKNVNYIQFSSYRGSVLRRTFTFRFFMCDCV